MEKRKIKCGSKYFETKYGEHDPVIEVEGISNFRDSFVPGSFLYLGRALAEGRQELLEGKTYYGHIDGLGEYVHESELGEVVP